MAEEEVIQKVGEVLRKNNASPMITDFMIDKVKDNVHCLQVWREVF